MQRHRNVLHGRLFSTSRCCFSWWCDAVVENFRADSMDNLARNPCHLDMLGLPGQIMNKQWSPQCRLPQLAPREVAPTLEPAVLSSTARITRSVSRVLAACNPSVHSVVSHRLHHRKCQRCSGDTNPRARSVVLHSSHHGRFSMMFWRVQPANPLCRHPQFASQVCQRCSNGANPRARSVVFQGSHTGSLGDVLTAPSFKSAVWSTTVHFTVSVSAVIIWDSEMLCDTFRRF